MGIVMSQTDVDRFREMLDKQRMNRRRKDENIERLETEIKNAKILPPDEIPDDVVTMRSLIRIREKKSGETKLFHLVYPHDSDPGRINVSILDPLGLAVIGARLGETVAWDTPQGRKMIVIERIHIQPESLRKYHL